MLTYHDDYNGYYNGYSPSIFVITIIVVILIFEFCAGIFEAIIIYQYIDRFNSECDQIKNWIIVGCIVNICTPIIILCTVKSIRISGANIKIVIFQVFQIGQIITTIWGLYLQATITHTCYHHWITDLSIIRECMGFHYLILGEIIELYLVLLLEYWCSGDN